VVVGSLVFQFSFGLVLTTEGHALHQIVLCWYVHDQKLLFSVVICCLVPLFLLFVWWSLNMFWSLCVVFVWQMLCHCWDVSYLCLCVVLCSVAIVIYVIHLMREICVAIVNAHVYWAKYLFLEMGLALDVRAMCVVLGCECLYQYINI